MKSTIAASVTGMPHIAVPFNQRPFISNMKQKSLGDENSVTDATTKHTQPLMNANTRKQPAKPKKNDTKPGQKRPDQNAVWPVTVAPTAPCKKQDQPIYETQQHTHN